MEVASLNTLSARDVASLTTLPATEVTSLKIEPRSEVKSVGIGKNERVGKLESKRTSFLSLCRDEGKEAEESEEENWTEHFEWYEDSRLVRE